MTTVTLNSGSVDSSGALTLKTNGSTTAVTIDTAQNMGLGVVPSAWSTANGYRAMQVGGYGSISDYSAGGGVIVGANMYAYALDGYKYLQSYYATMYQQRDGKHLWLNAVSGTAGDPITFTQAMTLDASGNLGIGTSSPVVKFDVQGGNVATFARVATSTSNNGAGVVFGGATAVKNWVIANQYNVAGLEFTQTTTNGGSTIGATPSMVLDNSGNLGIGTSSPNYRLDISGTSQGIANFVSSDTKSIIYLKDSGTTAGNVGLFSESNALGFRANGAERMRITSTGLFQMNSGYGSVATAYGCRVWVNFNGTGTIAIRGSGNITDITDGGVGKYTLNFTNAMPDANYAFVGTSGGGTSGGTLIGGLNNTTDMVYSSSSVLFYVIDASDNSAKDVAFVTAEVHR